MFRKKIRLVLTLLIGFVAIGSLFFSGVGNVQVRAAFKVSTNRVTCQPPASPGAPQLCSNLVGEPVAVYSGCILQGSGGTYLCENITGKISLSDTGAKVDCVVNITGNNTVDPKGVSINSDFVSCTKNGSNFPDPNGQCIVYMSSNQLIPTLGCVGGSSYRALVFQNKTAFDPSDDDVISVWDGGANQDCFAFATSTGSICIKEDELSSKCNGWNLGFGSLYNTIIGSAVKAIACRDIKDLAALKAANSIFNPVISDPSQANNINLTADCLAKIAAAGTNKTVTCNNNYTTLKKNTDGTWTDNATGTKYNSTTGKAISTSSTAGESNNVVADAAGGLASFLFGIVLFVVGVVLLIFSSIGLVILSVFAWLVIGMLDINPASLSMIGVAEKPWGLLASLGNLAILAAFMYVGFGYLFRIKSLTKDLGEFLAKIAYYAVLLNFTLLGVAAVYNVGFSVGTVVKYAYANTTNKAEVNQALVGNFVSSIAKTSYLRCKQPTDCNYNLANNNTNISNFSSLSGLFSVDAKKTFGPVVSEGVFLVVIGFALYVFWKVFYTIIYRLIFTWLLMVLSPLVLASFFSPVDQWKSLGKSMVNKFILVVLFYPAFIFALILANSMVGAFSSALNSQTPATNVSADSALAAIQAVTVNILQGVVSMMSLYLVTQYFTKSFEKDMGSVVNGSIKSVQDGWKGFQNGYGKAKTGMFLAAAPLRGLNSTLGKPIGKAISNSKIGKAYDDAYKGKKGNVLQLLARGSGAVGRTTGNVLNGSILHDIEDKAKKTKDMAWTSFQNGDKKIFTENERRNEEEIERGIRMLGMGGLIDNATKLKHRGKDRKWARTEWINGQDAEDIEENVKRGIASIIPAGDFESTDIVQRDLQYIAEAFKGNSAGLSGDEAFQSYLEKSLENGNEEILKLIARNQTMREAARLVAPQGILSEKALEKLRKDYYMLGDEQIQLDGINNNSAQSDQNVKHNVVNLLTDEYKTKMRGQLENRPTAYAQLNGSIENTDPLGRSIDKFLNRETKKVVTPLVSSATKDMNAIKSLNNAYNSSSTSNVSMYFDENYNIRNDEIGINKAVDNIKKELFDGLKPSDEKDPKERAKADDEAIRAKIPAEFTKVLSETGYLSYDKKEDKYSFNSQYEKNTDSAAIAVGNLVANAKEVNKVANKTSGLKMYIGAVDQLMKNPDLVGNEVKNIAMDKKVMFEIGMQESHNYITDETKSEVKKLGINDQDTINGIADDLSIGLAHIAHTQKTEADRNNKTRDLVNEIAKTYKINSGELPSFTTALTGLGAKVFTDSQSMNQQIIDNGKNAAERMNRDKSHTNKKSAAGAQISKIGTAAVKGGEVKATDAIG